MSNKENNFFDFVKISEVSKIKANDKVVSALSTSIALQFELDEDNMTEGELINTAFLQISTAASMCNAAYYGIKRERGKLQTALEGLAEAERNNQGTEISNSFIERALMRVESAEARILEAKYWLKNNMAAYTAIVTKALDYIPEQYAQNISLEWEPYEQKEQRQEQQKQTASALEAQEKLKKYGLVA